MKLLGFGFVLLAAIGSFIDYVTFGELLVVGMLCLILIVLDEQE